LEMCKEYKQQFPDTSSYYFPTEFKVELGF